jgi:hypothetical protein
MPKYFDFDLSDSFENPKYTPNTDYEFPTFPKIEDLTLIFAFDYLSLEQSNLCFNNPKLQTSDYTDIFQFLKKIADKSIDDFRNEQQIYHFHEVPLKADLKTALQNIFNQNRVRDYPALYQIAVYTDNTNQKAPRIVGFFGKFAIFHIIWLDFEHSIFPAR